MNKRLKPPEEWFTQSKYDLETAEAMFKTRRYIYTVFMCHLSIEKALKGLYTKRLNQIPPKVHNLVYLCEKIDLDLSDKYKEFIESLNSVSIPTRYPEELKVLIKEYDTGKTAKILNNNKELLKWLRTKLKN
jgi:HEPN domain-containing protein